MFHESSFGSKSLSGNVSACNNVKYIGLKRGGNICPVSLTGPLQIKPSEAKDDEQTELTRDMKREG